MRAELNVGVSGEARLCTRRKEMKGEEQLGTDHAVKDDCRKWRVLGCLMQAHDWLGAFAR